MGDAEPVSPDPSFALLSPIDHAREYPYRQPQGHPLLVFNSIGILPVKPKLPSVYTPNLDLKGSLHYSSKASGRGTLVKWVVVAVIVAFLLLVLFRCLRALTLGEATIHIAHMQTNEDARQVANVLNRLRGVVEARVDLEGQRVRITYRKGKIAVEDVMRALHGAGY